jgi:hypothetical protein
LTLSVDKSFIPFKIHGTEVLFFVCVCVCERERERDNTFSLCSVLRVKAVHETDFILVIAKKPNKWHLAASR